MIGYITIGIVSAAIGIWFGVGMGVAGCKDYRDNAKDFARQAKEWQDRAVYWRNECQEQTKHKEHIQAQLKNYRQAYMELMQERGNGGTSVNIDADVRDAIKFAMTNSHPDKPMGDQQAFIRFHKLYKKYCK